MVGREDSEELMNVDELLTSRYEERERPDTLSPKTRKGKSGSSKAVLQVAVCSRHQIILVAASWGEFNHVGQHMLFLLVHVASASVSKTITFFKTVR